MAQFVNPFDLKGNWYKANFHTHTTASDGGLPVEKVVANYRRKGYDVLVVSDHNATHDVRPLTSKRMLVISGIELHPPMKTLDSLFHIVGVNVPHAFDPHSKAADQANALIRRVNKAGGLAILAHPFWCGIAYEDFKHLKGLSAVEVFNTICDAGAGRGTSENEWAYMIDRGMNLPCVGVDDTHSGGRKGATDAFGGWTWLKMASPTTANVLKAIRTGACYASTGPTIHDFRVEKGVASVRCSPAARIHFKAGPGEGQALFAEGDRLVRSFSAPVRDGCPFIRVTVTDAAGRVAWSNPIYR